MSAKKKRQDAFKAKEKKQKIILAVGGVLFLGLLAFQVPRVMKQMNHGGSPPAAVPAVSTPSSTSPTPGLQAPTTVQGTGSSSSSSDSGGASLITSSDTSAAEGQLTSFSRFESKDPFQQQVDASTTVASTAEPAPGSASSGPPTGSPSSGGSPPGGTQPAPGGAVISVNGTLMSVTAGSDFPQASPLFHLISVTATTAKLSIAGGSYSNGAPSVTLHVNKPVTLMNTADGTRYKLILKPQGTPVPASAAPTSTAPAPTTPTPPSP